MFYHWQLLETSSIITTLFSTDQIINIQWKHTNSHQQDTRSKFTKIHHQYHCFKISKWTDSNHQNKGINPNIFSSQNRHSNIWSKCTSTHCIIQSFHSDPHSLSTNNTFSQIMGSPSSPWCGPVAGNQCHWSSSWIQSVDSMEALVIEKESII